VRRLLATSLLLGVALAPGAGASAGRIAGGGLSLALPPGWQGGVGLRGGLATLTARASEASLRLIELGNAPGTEGFLPARRAAVRGRDVVDRDRAARFGAPPGHALAARRLAVHGRSFLLVADLGRGRASEARLARANRVLARLRISWPAGLSPAARRSLRRPLRLPRLATGARCPISRTGRAAPRVGVTLGTGPAYPVLGAAEAGLRAHKTLWAIAPRYRGALLVRGRRLDGEGVLRFGPGRALESWWRGLWPEERSRWRYRPSTTLLPGPGCYAFRVDGTTFSTRIVFAAR
jgi:hypothetical protein